jgi:sugar transferase (PEP-CTERM/EpsH1 system associated)
MTGALYLAHRIPYPPHKGDKIRSHHWLRYLARDHDVHLGTFVDDPADLAHVGALDKWCEQKCVLRLRHRPAMLRSLAALPTKQALGVAYYRKRAMQRFVDRVLDENDIRIIFVFSSTMAQYVAGDRARGIRKVVDFVDVDSDKWRQYSEQRSWPMSQIYRRESVRLGEEERRIAADFDASILSSPAEVALFSQLAPEIAHKLHCVPNGVDTNYFDPGGDYPDPYPADSAPIVFTGAMDYWPNVDAVTYFAKHVFPEVRSFRSEARFFIVGAHPSKAVLELGRLPGVHVTGTVASVRPYLAHARLAVAPIRLARGIQNKVLEALAMRLPVLLTRSAQIGIGHENEDSGMTLASPHEMVDATLRQLELAPQVPQPGRAFVLRHFQWEPAFQELGRILDAS